jgi:hypothetical protein
MAGTEHPERISEGCGNAQAAAESVALQEDDLGAATAGTGSPSAFM